MTVPLAVAGPDTTSAAPGPVPATAPPTGGRRAAVWLLHAYQVARAGHVSPCRFSPTCSEYAVHAVSAHGVRRGVALSARRLTRCRPGGPFGYDPVPPGPFSSPPKAPDLGGNRALLPADASSEPPVPE